MAFGDIPLNRVGERELTIRNTGTGELTVFNVEITDSAGGMFTMEPFSPNTVVPPEDSTRVTLLFTPSDRSDHIGEVAIETDAPGTDTVKMSLTGRGILDVTGTTVTADPDHITAHPDSISEITVTPMDTLGRKIDPNFITVFLSATAGTFTNGQDTVTAAPQPDSTYTAGIFYAETDVERETTVRATVSGRVIADTVTVTFVPLVSSKIVISPAPVYFGRVRAGTSEKRTLLVGNDGKATLMIANIATGTTIFDPAVEEILVPSTQIRAIEVAFTPLEVGSFSDSLTFATNDPARPSVSIPLSGQGGRPEVVLSSDRIDFGRVTTINAPDRAVRISNPGTWPLTVTGLDITEGADAFRVMSPTTPQTVQPANTLDVTIRFAPRDTRIYPGILRITSDAYGHPEEMVVLRGEGVSSFTSIEVTPEADTVLVDTMGPAAFTTATFMAEGILSDLSRQDVTAIAAWSVTDSTVASVTAGVAGGIRPGTVGIVATLEALSDTSALKVIQPVPVDENGEEIQGLFGDDDTVGMDDFLLFVDMFGSTAEDAGFEEEYDLNGDSVVGLDDFLVFVVNFGKVAANY